MLAVPVQSFKARGWQPLWAIEKVVALEYAEIGKDNAFLVRTGELPLFRALTGVWRENYQ